MAADIPESDWKAFRKLREAALQRLCERILRAVGRIAANEGDTFHARYLAVYGLIEEQNSEMAHAFDNPRRSTAVEQLALMASSELVTAEELGTFTPDTRVRVEALCNTDRRARGAKGT